MTGRGGEEGERWPPEGRPVARKDRGYNSVSSEEALEEYWSYKYKMVCHKMVCHGFVKRMDLFKKCVMEFDSPLSSGKGVLVPVLKPFSNHGWEVIFLAEGRWLGSSTSIIIRNSLSGLREG